MENLAALLANKLPITQDSGMNYNQPSPLKKLAPLRSDAAMRLAFGLAYAQKDVRMIYSHTSDGDLENWFWVEQNLNSVPRGYVVFQGENTDFGYNFSDKSDVVWAWMCYTWHEDMKNLHWERHDNSMSRWVYNQELLGITPPPRRCVV